ncbi:CCA-adding enzyme [Sebaldella termitidis]|uniref:Bis(5'-nucleosyl)-tetraphosphatase [asymmetrical] n=1 Tax=Sebaldella termitidis (strain ATCC 33386 / NCTC 11300) TaxID=526218 RepID=D1AKE0_SEBTE|nr:NUDIX domain-containing protein [Sebaldella termitidis]ACZ09056.1 polynucleotide adenylyltransferase/metal dependent phosphohydrolase [Sebaldella termitidis ATCC 33386]SUI24374.1 CCA-adding enzyme [Sebaldella termitidis]
MIFELNNDVEFILDILNKNGEGYIVGGSVRDILLGVSPKDYDFTTNIAYSTLKELFKDYNPKEIGKHFGILMIKINGIHYEIAKFRKDIGILNGRHPESVKFVDEIAEDLKRRDFTINAMAYSRKNGLIDLYNGSSDIKNKLIRFVGDPGLRIKEDALRILRAVRFVSALGFDLETETKKAILKNKLQLKKISKERIREEFSKILLSDYVDKGLLLMKELGILEIIIPEIEMLYEFNQNNPHHHKDVFAHTVSVVKNTQKDLLTRITALFHDIGKPNTHSIDKNGISHYYGHENNSAEIASAALRRLKFPNDFIRDVDVLIRNHMIIFEKPGAKAIKKFICKVGIENLDKIFDHFYADMSSKKPPVDYSLIDSLKSKVDEIIDKNENIEKQDLEINGNDMLALKIQQKQISKIKNEIYEKVLDGNLENNKKDIVNYIMNTKGINEELQETKSSGAIVYKVEGNEIKYLLIMLIRGNWGFPKGHFEGEETEKETAVREIFEETGLNVKFHDDFRETIQYFPAPFIFKTVIYFLAEAVTDNVKIQTDEVAEYRWATYDEAAKLITYRLQKKILKKANDMLSNELK